MDMRREVFERYVVTSWNAPKVKSPIIHFQLVGIDIPRPEGDAGGLDGEPQLLGVPQLGL